MLVTSHYQLHTVDAEPPELSSISIYLLTAPHRGPPPRHFGSHAVRCQSDAAVAFSTTHALPPIYKALAWSMSDIRSPDISRSFCQPPTPRVGPTARSFPLCICSYLLTRAMRHLIVNLIVEAYATTFSQVLGARDATPRISVSGARDRPAHHRGLHFVSSNFALPPSNSLVIMLLLSNSNFFSSSILAATTKLSCHHFILLSRPNSSSLSPPPPNQIVAAALSPPPPNFLAITKLSCHHFFVFIVIFVAIFLTFVVTFSLPKN